ncbi:MAG TPA: DUF6230 family protein [Terriglobales bacterium]|nr:DUF6230 family protein [Terriglobales bacterium]
MADEAAEPVVGRTRWRRFLIVLAPAYAAIAGLIFLAASGTLAVSFAVSGTALTITADSLTTGAADGNNVGLYQFGVADFAGNGTPVPQVETVIPNATLANLCQSVSVGPLTLRTTAGTAANSPVTATGLVVDATSIAATSATFTNINIGQDIGQFNNPALTAPTGRGTGPNVNTANVPAGTFGQTATKASLGGLRQVANGQTAASLTLPGLNVGFGAPC